MNANQVCPGFNRSRTLASTAGSGFSVPRILLMQPPIRLNFRSGKLFARIRSVEIVAFEISVIEGAKLAKKESYDWMVNPFCAFAKPSGFWPDHFMDDFFERREHAGEIAGVLAIECCSCCLLNCHHCLQASGSGMGGSLKSFRS